MKCINMCFRFDSFDVDGSGTIDLDEFTNSPQFKSSHLVTSTQGMIDEFYLSPYFFLNAFFFSFSIGMFAAIDKDKSNDITLEELFAAYFRFASKKELNDMNKHANKVRIEKKAQIHLTEYQMKEIQEMFNLYDVNKVIIFFIDKGYF